MHHADQYGTLAGRLMGPDHQTSDNATSDLSWAERALAFSLPISPPIAFFLAAVISVRWRRQVRMRRDDRRTLIVIALILGLGALGSIGAASPVRAAEGLLAMVILFWFWMIGRFIVRAPQRFSIDLQRAIGVVGALAVLVALTHSSLVLHVGSMSLVIWGPENKGTVFGLGGNGLGPLLVFGGVLALGRFAYERSRWARLEALLLAAVSIAGPIALGVRNGLWGAVVGAVVLAPITGAAAILVIVAVVGIVLWLQPGLMARVAALVQPASEQERWGAWRAALSIIRDHPWLGVGPYQFSEVYPMYAPPESRHLSDPHSIYLRVASEWGVPAALLLYGWMISWAKRIWALRKEGWRWSLLAGFFSFLAMGVFDTPLFTFHISAPVLVGLGLAGSQGQADTTN